MNDELARAQAGDVNAFTRLVRGHERAVFSLALRMLGRRDAAEDIAQEVFMQLHRKLNSIESAAHLAFWLRKVTAHRAIDQLRRSHAEAPLEDAAEPACTGDAVDPLLQRRLHSLILDLSPPARAVVTLRFQEDLDPLEIARTLDMPVNTVKSHLKRSLEVLRRGLDDSVAKAYEDYLA